jgi:selenocysteine-specific elongation factor
LLEAANGELAAFHQRTPLRAGMARSELASRLGRLLPEGTGLPFLERVVALGLLAGPSPQTVAAAGFEVQLTRRQREQVGVIGQALAAGGMQPPSLEDLAADAGIPVKDAKLLLTFLVDTGQAVCVEGALYFAMATVRQARRRLADAFTARPEATPADIRDLLGTTRKYLIPLLQHFDDQRWTLRRDDVRVAGPLLLDGID